MQSTTTAAIHNYVQSLYQNVLLRNLEAEHFVSGVMRKPDSTQFGRNKIQIAINY